jgi:hypothetical protein
MPARHEKFCFFFGVQTFRRPILTGNARPTPEPHHLSQPDLSLYHFRDEAFNANVPAWKIDIDSPFVVDAKPNRCLRTRTRTPTSG